jgi:chorismate mutase
MKFPALNSWFPGIAGGPVLVAGPCGAESREQIFRTAEGLRSLPVFLFRAGVWKPRTRPDSFEGRGEEALKWLKELQQEKNLRIAVEVANAGHAELALKYGMDALWIGARSTGNPFSVQEIANALKGSDIPVLVKNPVHADLQLWIGAIERMHKTGLRRIAAVHRGFHFYGNGHYRNRPLWNLPIELKTQFPDLPLICDPSHISGKREFIPALAQEALDLGMNGLMIETHFDPAHALSDREQQLKPAELADLFGKLVMRKATEGTDHTLEGLRMQIDEIDEELLQFVKKRLQVVDKIGRHKKKENITIFQLERWQEILRTRGEWAEELGISRRHVEKICELLHEESIRIQNEVMRKPDPQNKAAESNQNF